MAVYKVIQDIEAEDKFLGPLTLKQFIFAGITVLCLYLGFFFVTKNLWYLALPLFPIIGVGGFLAFPWGRDQPTEVWLLAKLRFYFKPRKRVWDQTGVQELVTITAPKRDETQYTNNLSQTEVKSRLQALAETIDSRGWAVKNVNLNMFSPQTAATIVAPNSDRLVDLSVLPHEVAQTDISAADDIMDPLSNPLAQQLDQMISQSGKTHRQAALDKMRDVAGGQDEPAGLGAPAPNYWFINQPDPASTPLTSTVDDSTLSPEEQALLDRVHEEQAVAESTPIHSHMRVIKPLSTQDKTKPRKQDTKKSESKKAKAAKKAAEPAKNPPPQPVTPAPDPAILELASNNNLSVASLAKEANAKLNQPDEVVINLH